MLREFTHLKQEASPGFRRWFESDGFDLVVWYASSGDVTGFQICYDFGQGEHAFTWRKSDGWSHHAIDSGDRTPLRDLTPILIPDGAVPWPMLRAVFAERSRELDPGLRELVGATLRSTRESRGE